ncbi:MAG: carotenoid 1,2-hydratase [Steroidobacteraceae bacterium]
MAVSRSLCSLFRAAGAMLVTVLLASAIAAAAEYPPVVRGTALAFPQDEGSHPQYRIEWWYVTGWLQDDAGRSRGFQVTFFRNRPGLDEGNPSQFAAHQLLFAHAAISDPAVGHLLHDERVARAGFGLADAREGSTDVVLEDWSLRQDGQAYHVNVPGKDFELVLDLAATQPPLLQGDAGFSQKGPDPASASHYYSQPQMAVSGRINIGGRDIPVRGTAWFDHEWSSTLMDDAAQGWDWLGINLADGGALTAFRMRDAQGGSHWAAAGIRRGSGAAATTSVYRPQQIEWQPQRQWRSPRTGIDYPVEWRVRVGEDWYRVRPLFDDQESDSRRSTGTIYWEGAVELLDGAGAVVGRGYLELTGYGTRLRM